MKKQGFKREGETLIVKEWKCGKGNKVRVTLHDYAGRELFSIREWYRDPETRTDKPGKRGISFVTDDFAKVYSGIRRIKRLLDARRQ